MTIVRKLARTIHKLGAFQVPSARFQVGMC